jgi:hypothetical protein
MREETGIEAAHVGTTVCNTGPELYQMMRREELIAHLNAADRQRARRWLEKFDRAQGVGRLHHTTPGTFFS